MRCLLHLCILHKCYCMRCMHAFPICCLHAFPDCCMHVFYVLWRHAYSIQLMFASFPACCRPLHASVFQRFHHVFHLLLFFMQFLPISCLHLTILACIPFLFMAFKPFLIHWTHACIFMCISWQTWPRVAWGMVDVIIYALWVQRVAFTAAAEQDGSWAPTREHVSVKHKKAIGL